MTWREEADPALVADLDALNAGVRAHAEGMLLSAWRFPPFVITLRAHRQVVLESALPLAEAQAAFSDGDVVAVAAVSTDRGHYTHWLRTRMQHRLDGPRVEVITDYKRVGLFRKRVTYAEPVEAILDSNGPLARQFEIDAERAADPRV